MKNSIKITGVLLLFWNLVFLGCKKSDTPPDLILDSLKMGTIDLIKAKSATLVPVAGDIVATCNTTVAAIRVNTSNITLKRGTVAVKVTVTASGNKITIHPVSPLLNGTKYTLKMTNLTSDNNKPLADRTDIFTTIGIGPDSPPQAASQVIYLQFNGNILDIIGHAIPTFEQVSYSTDRFGTANAAASFNGGTAAGNGDIVELQGPFINESTTVSVWFKVNSSDYAGPESRVVFGIASERGMFLELGGDLDSMRFVTCHHNIRPVSNNHYFGTSWDDPNGSGRSGGSMIGTEYRGKIADLIKDKWTHLVMTYDAATSVKTIFINGENIYKISLADVAEGTFKDMVIAGLVDGTSDDIEGIDYNFALGYYCSRANSSTSWSKYSKATNTFKGALDDFRIFNKALTDNEVTELYYSEKVQ